MTPELINLFGQLPLVGIFIAFVLVTRGDDRKERAARESEWREFIKTQNEALSIAVNKLCESFNEHDTKTQAILEVLKERTLPSNHGRISK